MSRRVGFLRNNNKKNFFDNAYEALREETGQFMKKFIPGIRKIGPKCNKMCGWSSDFDVGKCVSFSDNYFFLFPFLLIYKIHFLFKSNNVMQK